MSTRNKFRALRGPERVLLLQSLLLLPVTALSVKVVGVQRWQTMLARMTAQRRPSLLGDHLSGRERSFGLKTRDAKQIARLVRAAANHGLYRANCLDQSLVLWSMLKRHGIQSEIRFGARKEEDELQAHAWVECLGIALNEDRGVEQRYAPFAGVTKNTAGESSLREPVRSR